MWILLMVNSNKTIQETPIKTQVTKRKHVRSLVSTYHSCDADIKGMGQKPKLISTTFGNHY